MLGGPGRVTQRRQDRYRVTPCGTVFFRALLHCSARAPLRKTSVSGSAKLPGRESSKTSVPVTLLSDHASSRLSLFLRPVTIVEPVSVIDNRVSGRIQDAKTEIEKSRTDTPRRNSRLLIPIFGTKSGDLSRSIRAVHLRYRANPFFDAAE